MSVGEYRELARKAAGKAGPPYLKNFFIYAAIITAVNLVIYALETPLYQWYTEASQLVQAESARLLEAGALPLPSLEALRLPPVTGRLLGCVGFALLLGLMTRTVTTLWLRVALRASRGESSSWHELTNLFPMLWKVAVIHIIYVAGCTLASYLLLFPGVLLFYNWRLSYFVLAEHPEYGPLQCLRQSRKLMTGERMNLFRLDLSLLTAYLLPTALYVLSNGILRLWKLPSVALLYAVFYNKMVYWRPPEETETGGAA